MFSPGRILRWIYIGRLSVATAIFVAAVFVWQKAEAADTLVAALALFTAILFTAASAWHNAIYPERVAGTRLYPQTLFDLILVTAVVHVTGGAASKFAALYLLVSASASLLLPGRGGLLIAALGTALYSADVFWGHGTPVDIGVALQLGIFAVVALGTAYLSARLREAGPGREELEAQLVRVRLHSDDILRNIRSGIITVDSRLRLLYANPAAGHMLGFNSATTVGKPIEALLSQRAPALARALERTVRERVRTTRGEATITADGRSFPIGLTTTAIDADSAGAGAHASATVIFQDISDGKRLEELRLRAERLEAVAELSASLAHEIKNPLASIHSAVEQLGRAPRATEDERALSALIVRESDRLARLLSEFLDFARARVTRMERVDIGAVARDAAGLAAAHPDGARGVRVMCQMPDDPVLVEGDVDLLHRAVFNITLNAVQAAPEAGHVKVEVAPLEVAQVPEGASFDRAAVALRVTDNGPGIPAEIRDRLFDPFFTTKAGGTGLGLPIVHRAIEAHRGLVFVDSGERGTSFTVLLPRWQPDERQAAVAPDGRSASGPSFPSGSKRGRAA